MADDRTYIKLHDGMPRHPKVTGLSDKEFRTQIEAMCYCSTYLTDGAIPYAEARKLAPPRVWARLVQVGLIEDTGEHYLVHDYLEHQRSAEQVEQLKANRRQAGSRGGKAKAKALASAKQVLGASKANRGNRTVTTPLGSVSPRDDERETIGSDFPADCTVDFALTSNNADPGLAKALASASPVASDLLKQTPSKTVAETESLTYVRDQAEDSEAKASGRKRPPVVPDDEGNNAGDVVALWIESLNRRPPGSVIGQVGKHVKALLQDGFTEQEIRDGLIAMSAKGLNPSTLPSLVNDVVNNVRPIRSGTGGPVDHSGAGRKQQVQVGDRWRDVTGDEVVIGRKTRWVTA